jgi:hypothetical protein
MIVVDLVHIGESGPSLKLAQRLPVSFERLRVLRNFHPLQVAFD